MTEATAMLLGGLVFEVFGGCFGVSFRHAPDSLSVMTAIFPCKPRSRKRYSQTSRYFFCWSITPCPLHYFPKRALKPSRSGRRADHFHTLTIAERRVWSPGMDVRGERAFAVLPSFRLGKDGIRKAIVEADVAHLPLHDRFAVGVRGAFHRMFQ